MTVIRPLLFCLLALSLLAAGGGCRPSVRPGPVDDDGAKDGAGGKDGGRKDAGGESARPSGRLWRTREVEALSAAWAKKAAPGSLVVSPDGRRWAAAIPKFGGWVYVADGVEEKTPYRKVFGATFSDDGKDFAYVGHVAEETGVENAQYEIVLNGKAYPVPHRTHKFDPSRPTMSGPTNRILAVHAGKVAYTALDTTSRMAFPPALDVFINGTGVARPKALDKYGTFQGQQLAVVPSGAALRVVGVADGGVSVDGKLVYKTADTVQRVVASGDGSTWAAVCETSGAPKREMYVVIDGEEKKRMESVEGLVLSPDGKHHAYFGTLGKRYLVVDGKASETSTTGQITLAPDGTRAAAAPSDTAGKWPGHPYRTFAISPDARRAAAVATWAENTDAGLKSVTALFVDGKEVRRGTFEGAPVWSPDGSSWAIVRHADGGKSVNLLHDGVAGPDVDMVLTRADNKTPILQFSRDGRSLAYPARFGLETKVVINGAARGAYDQVGVGDTRIGFTPDGRLTYLARKGNGSLWHVTESPPGLEDEPRKPAGVSAPGTQVLFDGGDLSKWRVERDGWSVKDGLLVGKGGKMCVLTTAGAGYKDYRLRVVARTTPRCRAYLAVRGAWVRICNTGDEGRTGTIDPDGGHDVPPNVVGSRETPKAAADGEWFTLDVLVIGRKVAARVNGKRVALADMPKDAPDTAAIRLFFHWAETTSVAFRSIEVTEDVRPEDLGAF